LGPHANHRCNETINAAMKELLVWGLLNLGVSKDTDVQSHILKNLD
jgi:hypothetical protein